MRRTFFFMASLSVNAVLFPSVTEKPKGVITPPVFPLTEEEIGLYVDADFLWWKSNLSGMTYAEIDEKSISPGSRFAPGFKFGIGADLEFDGWDTYMEYTGFYTPETRNSRSAKEEPSYSYFVNIDESTGSLGTFLLESGSASRKEQFNILDWDLGRNFFISRRLTLRPAFGLKGARIREKTKLTQKPERSDESIRTDLSQTLSGIGIRGGAETVWYVFNSLGIYGNLAITALWSSIHNTFSFRGIDSDRAGKQKTQTILPVIEAGLGISYRKHFHENRYMFYAKAGWEEQIWIGYNYNMPNGTPNTTGNLTLQGVTLQAGLAF